MQYFDFRRPPGGTSFLIPGGYLLTSALPPLHTHRSETLSLLHSISSTPFTLEAGRRWSVALLRQGSHVEFGRLPEYLVPALVSALGRGIYG